MSQVKLILVGGFLGAGKTTLLHRAANHLQRMGRRFGLIANDQTAHLVDTGILEREGFPVREVSGGCFCCHFDALVSRAEDLITTINPEILIGEPVGSCTDISATVIQPLKKLYPDRFQLAPFTVLADPFRLEECLDESRPKSFPESVFYIFLKQLEEADAIVVNKADRITPGQMARLESRIKEYFPEKPILLMSALNDIGVEAWLRYVLHEEASGRWLAEVDYDTYADGEAALGWLNASIHLALPTEVNWMRYGEDLMNRLRAEFQERSAEVAHLKLILCGPGRTLQANWTGGGAEPLIQIAGAGEWIANHADLILNARAHLSPRELRQLVELSLNATAGSAMTVRIDRLDCFQPARPQPTHRYTIVVM